MWATVQTSDSERCGRVLNRSDRNWLVLDGSGCGLRIDCRGAQGVHRRSCRRLWQKKYGWAWVVMEPTEVAVEEVSSSEILSVFWRYNQQDLLNGLRFGEETEGKDGWSVTRRLGQLWRSGEDEQFSLGTVALGREGYWTARQRCEWALGHAGLVVRARDQAFNKDALPKRLQVSG